MHSTCEKYDFWKHNISNKWFLAFRRLVYGYERWVPPDFNSTVTYSTVLWYCNTQYCFCDTVCTQYCFGDTVTSSNVVVILLHPILFCDTVHPVPFCDTVTLCSVLWCGHTQYIFVIPLWSRGQISNFEFCCTPQEEIVGYYFQSGTCLGASETHVLLSFLWSGFCKWPVITVTPQTLKITLHKIQDL